MFIKRDDAETRSGAIAGTHAGDGKAADMGCRSAKAAHRPAYPGKRSVQSAKHFSSYTATPGTRRNNRVGWRISRRHARTWISRSVSAAAGKGIISHNHQRNPCANY